MSDEQFASEAERAAFTAASVPTIATEPVPVCDKCGSPAHRELTRGRDYESITCRNEWTFVACEQCGLVRLHPRPALSTLSTIYPPTYYAYSYESTIPWIARAGKEMLDRRKLRGITSALARPVRSYADIGCGTGRYLRAMAESGVPKSQIHGLELDANVVTRLKAEGFQAHHDRVETCTAIAPGSLDLATMFHVIEHVDAPSAVLSKVAEWMAPDGVLALETPNIDSLDARRFKDRWWGGYHTPRHWTLFSPDTLQAMLRAHGFEPFAVRYQTGHSFWMYSFHHKLKFGVPARPGLARFFHPLSSVIPLAAFTAFDLIRGALGFKTSAMLILARRKAR